MAVAEAIGPKILIPYMLRKMPRDIRSAKLEEVFGKLLVDV